MAPCKIKWCSKSILQTSSYHKDGITFHWRRWHLLLVQALFAAMLFLVAVFSAKAVFLTPVQDEPEPPLAFADLLHSIDKKVILGYAPFSAPFTKIMERASEMLGIQMMAADSLEELNLMLYNRSRGNRIVNDVMWVIWEPKEYNMHKFAIRSTEVARYVTQTTQKVGCASNNPHLRAGFLAVQLAVSQAVLEHVSTVPPRFNLNLVSMPVSPLMEEDKVRRTISLILMCYTLALLPPVLETEALVVTETLNRFKRGLRIRNVDYSTIYIAWLMYALMTALPICLLGSIALILIFRWIHLIYALLILLAYTCVMIMLALIMAMFHNRAWVACIWTTLFTLMNTFLAELLVHHEYDRIHEVLTFIMQMVLPPLGLVNGFNQFALLQTGRGNGSSTNSLLFTIFLWLMMIFVYFQLLMLLQRTIGKERAIGGQVGWRSIIFKKAVDVNKVRHIEEPTGIERDKLQEIDDFIAKAVSFRSVTKSVMNVCVLKNVTFDICRGEFTMLFAERIQDRMMHTIENLLTGLTHADSGSINVLGREMRSGQTLMSEPHMMGYCENSRFLIEDFTVEEHFTFYTEICLWNQTRQFVYEYGHLRSMHLRSECDLQSVWLVHVRHLDIYYRAQLCWAIALLLEPRVIIWPNFADHPCYMNVLKDKIVRYKKYLTVVRMTYASMHLEYADRAFLFDGKNLAFGGTPAYMFFKFGREYRVRITFRSSGSMGDVNSSKEVIDRATAAGAAVRAHFGALLILRLPASPTKNVASLVQDLHDNASKYGITSMNISLPDSEEVCSRAMTETRETMSEFSETNEISDNALKRIQEPRPWKKKKTRWSNLIQLKIIGHKFKSFYLHQYKLVLLFTALSAIAAGLFIGLALANLLINLIEDRTAKMILKGEVLTVEALEMKTTLVIRVDNNENSRSVANA